MMPCSVNERGADAILAKTVPSTPGNGEAVFCAYNDKGMLYMPSRIDTLASRSARERGISLIEAVLYLSIVASVVVLSAALIQDQQRRQENTSIAQQYDTLLRASSRYVRSEYDDIRENLFQSALDDGFAKIAITPQDLQDDGYLPSTFNVTDGNIFGQNYGLMIRGVGVDGSMKSALDLDDGSGNIKPDLVDYERSNDEFLVEALFTSYQGDEIPSNRGASIVVQTENPIAGFVSPNTVGPGGAANSHVTDGGSSVTGAFGNFEYDLADWSNLISPEEGYPLPGRFAAPVALADFGVLDMENPGIPIGEGVDDPLRRCADILDEPGQNKGSDLYTKCLAADDMYSSMVFKSYDSDGDGANDKLPGIEGLTELACEDSGGSGIATAGTLVVTCSETKFSGNINVVGNTSMGGDTAIGGNTAIDGDTAIGGNTAIDGDANVGGSVRAERFVAESIGGQDLAEGIYDSRIMVSGDTIEKPECNGTAITGEPLAPRVYVVPAVFADPRGAATASVRAYAEDLGTEWRVRLFNFIVEDQCTSDVLNPLSYSSPNTAACASSDGLTDVYELDSDTGRVHVTTRCF